jgi:hypothetical protein
MKRAVATLLVAASLGLLPKAADAYPPADQQRLVEATAALQAGLIAAAGDQAAAGAAFEHYRAFLQTSQNHIYKDLEVRVEGLRITGNGVVVTMDMPTPNRASVTSRLVLVNDLRPMLLSQGDAHFLGTLKPGSQLRVDGQIVGLLHATLANPDLAQVEFRFDKFRPQP